MFRNRAPHHPGRRRQGGRRGPAPRHRAAQGLPEARSRRTSCSSPCREEIGSGGRQALRREGPEQPVRSRLRLLRGRWAASRPRRPASRHVHGHLPRPRRPRRAWSRSEDGAPSRRPPGPSPPCIWAGSTRRPAPTSASSTAEWAPTSCPTLCEIRGECRSHDEEKLARRRRGHGRRPAGRGGAGRRRRRHRLVHEYRAFALTGRSPVVRLSQGRRRRRSGSSRAC